MEKSKSLIPPELISEMDARKSAVFREKLGMSRAAYSKFTARLRSGDAKDVERILAVAEHLGFTLRREKSRG